MTLIYLLKSTNYEALHEAIPSNLMLVLPPYYLIKYGGREGYYGNTLNDLSLPLTVPVSSRQKRGLKTY
jgi:hypothetical protein